MSNDQTILLPKLGESIVGATVVQWLKNIGDQVALDEPLLEVSTDKVNSEIPSPFAGVLKKQLVVENQEIEVGAPLALIDTNTSDSFKKETALQASVPVAPLSSTIEGGRSQQQFFSPAVLSLAQTEGLSMEVLKEITPTGEGGRITKRDVENYINVKQKNPSCPLQKEMEKTSRGPVEERIAFSGVRKAIADNLVRSFYEAPHASLVSEIDVTEAIRLIAKEKERFLAAHGAKLTITTFLLQALIKSLQQFPLLNASVEKETIVLKKYINVGIAVNLDQKGLIVPVIKNCQEKNVIHLAKAVADLSSRARAGKLIPDDVAGGTITLTNFGMTGALIGVPIIRYPEVAILGAGTIAKRVVVREDNSFAVREMMYVTLTFDHRIIDGIYGCEFMSALKANLESVTSPEG